MCFARQLSHSLRANPLLQTSMTVVRFVNLCRGVQRHIPHLCAKRKTNQVYIKICKDTDLNKGVERSVKADINLQICSQTCEHVDRAVDVWTNLQMCAKSLMLEKYFSLAGNKDKLSDTQVRFSPDCLLAICFIL